MARYVAVLAVLPAYRSEFVRLVRQAADGDSIDFASGREHLIASVRSGEGLATTTLQNVALLGRRLLWQRGGIRAVRHADSVVIDLNPRSLTAWAILLSRWVFRRRTLVWGHIHPRKGPGAKTMMLRKFMRNRADGTICYTWADREQLLAESPSASVWVAANGLYPRSEIRVVPAVSKRTDFLYVGRLVREKKPLLLLEAFARLLASSGSDRGWRLIYVGDGVESERIRSEAEKLGIADRVVLVGHNDDLGSLRSLYAQALCAVSPGYAGLSLTQSLGFGVPMVVADDEPHAPEIELFDESTGRWFRAGDADSLAHALAGVAGEIEDWDAKREGMSRLVREKYSADSMAEGFLTALRGGSQ